MSFQIKVQHQEDSAKTINRHDLADMVLRRYRRIFLENPEYCQRNETQNMIIVLRLSLMKTLWEIRGYLDLPYIDSVIRQVITGFKNKHHREIEQKHWAILADMCQQEIDHNARIEPEEETDPVDIDVTDEDIDAWIKSEL